MTQCWTEKEDWIEEKYGIGSNEWCEEIDAKWKGGEHVRTMLCLLPEGHKGEHEWTDSRGLTLTVAPILTEEQEKQNAVLN